MKISLASQLMSHSVASLMLHCVSTGQLPSDALSTAVFIKTVDQLFDSFNATKTFPENGKEIKTALSDISPHFQFWDRMENSISQWKFVRYRGGKPPSQKGWLSNIKAMRGLWQKIKNESSMHYLKTRNINQDALENMFGGIRGYCGSNTNPTSQQFIYSLRCHIINGLTNRSIQTTNCKRDHGELLTNLIHFFEDRSTGSEQRSDEVMHATVMNQGVQLEEIQMQTSCRFRQPMFMLLDT
ncbi:hypothetical protein QE152_g35268 [Popillia japonica]|uniref:Transposase n=1 Tax=Popillia japonica TaxID=7064 RepID=A0AAW1IG48_POPJA